MLPQSRNGVNTSDATVSQSQTVCIEDGKLVLQTGAPVTATLKYGTPLTGQNRWGNDYYKYTLLVNGEEVAWFAPHKVSEALQRLGARNGSTLVIERGQVRQNGRDKGFYTGSLDGKAFEVTSTGNVVTHGNGNANANGNGQPQRSSEDVQRDAEALYGDDRYHAASHGYGLTKEDVTEPQQPSERNVYVELSTGVFKFTLQEFSELLDWVMVNAGAVA